MQYTGTLAPAPRTTSTRPPARIHRRDTETVLRTAAAVAVALLLIATVAVAALTLLTRPESPEPQAWTSISVGPTDSVWAVAAAHPVQGHSTASTVELICVRNNLKSATVHPGQVLLVPHVSAAQTALALR